MCMADTGHSFSAYFKRATSPLVVLALLRERAMYGYEISSEMSQRSDGQFTISVLYPVLYRLQEQGYIEISETEIVEGRARSYYQITQSGQSYLEKTLHEYHAISDVFEKLLGGDTK